MAVMPKATSTPKVKLVLYVVGIFVLCGLWSGVEIAFATTQTVGVQSLSMLASLGWLAALIAGVICAKTQWRYFRLWAGLPLLVCLGS